MAHEVVHFDVFDYTVFRDSLQENVSLTITITEDAKERQKQRRKEN